MQEGHASSLTGVWRKLTKKCARPRRSFPSLPIACGTGQPLNRTLNGLPAHTPLLSGTFLRTVCQNWLRRPRRNTRSYLRASVHRRRQRPKVWVMWKPWTSIHVRQSTMVESNVTSKHARKHEAHPPRVKTNKKKGPSRFSLVLFVLTQAMWAAMKRNACYSKLSCLLQTYCHSSWAPADEKHDCPLSSASKSRFESLSYGVTNYGSALEDGCCKLMVGIYCMPI